RSASGPGDDHERCDQRDAEQSQQDDAVLDTWCRRRPLCRAPRAQRGVVLSDDVTGVVLVDVELAVEAQILGVRAKEARDGGLGRQQLELLVLERAEVLPADLRVLLDLREIEGLAQARLS